MEIASFVLGILSFLFSFIPIINLVSIVLSKLSIIFAVFAFGKKVEKGRKILACTGIILSLLAFTMVNFMYKGFIEGSKKSNTQEISVSKVSIEQNPKLNIPFKFNDLEITVSDKITIDTVKTEDSKQKGKEIISLPVTIRNLKSTPKALGTINFEFTGPTGSKLPPVSDNLEDTSIDYVGKLEAGEVINKNFNLLYEGDGNYTIKFNSYYEKTNLDFNIKID